MIDGNGVTLKIYWMLVLFLLLLSACGGPVRSGDRGRGGPPPDQKPQMTADQKMAMLQTRLHLTQEQDQKIRPIIEAEYARLDAIFSEYRSPDHRERGDVLKSKLAAVEKSTLSQLKGILTEAQVDEYKKIMAEQRPGPKHGPPPGGGGRGGPGGRGPF